MPLASRQTLGEMPEPRTLLCHILKSLEITRSVWFGWLRGRYSIATNIHKTLVEGSEVPEEGLCTRT